MINNKSKTIYASFIPVIFFLYYILTGSLTDIKNTDRLPKEVNASISNDFDTDEVSEEMPPRKIVVLDAGHGGYDPGAVGPSGAKEKDITLAITLKAGSILEENGIAVVYTRTSDIVPWPSDNKADLMARAEISNSLQTQLFVSIHVNSFNMESVRGTETYFRTGSLKGEEAAELIHSQIIKDVGMRDRGLRDETYSVLRNVYAPAVLLELGYISNRNEELLLKDVSYQENFARAIARGVLNYMAQIPH
jgi:N-acetylmuramoyl-L-alanine amidase